MATLSKRTLIGVMLVVSGSVAALLFIGSLVCGWLWVSDPDRSDMEPILALAGLIFSPALAIAAALLARLRATSTPRPVMSSTGTAKPTEWNRIRDDLIRTVRSHWIDDYLHHSVYQRIRIKLGVEKTPEAIDHPYDIERISGGNTELVTNLSLLRLFDESGGSLLILGEPGSGKTITLVQLAGLLLDRAASDPEAAVPVVVPLASWAVDRNPLEEWLRGELMYHYGLSARTTPQLLREGKRLILLLDGLDEVRASLRTECLATIQRFKAGFSADIVVCCRVTEYQALPQRIAHGEAIRILPLTAGQIDAYFAAFGGRLGSLIQSLRERAELRELAETPLMLNILATIYGSEERVAKVPASASLDVWRDAIFTRYVRLMFRRKEHKVVDGAIVPEDVPFSRAQAVHWLQQIARRMSEQQIVTLYLEGLSARWVARRWKYVVTAGMAYGSIYGLINGLLNGLILGLMNGLIGGLIFGATIALILALILEFTGKVQLVEAVRFRFDWRKLIAGLILGLCATLVGALICGLIGALVWGLVGGWFVGPIAELSKGLYARLFFGFLIGLCIGVIWGLILGPMYGLIVGLTEMRSHPQPSRPNQGIRNSARISIFAGMIGGLLAGGASVPLGGFGLFGPLALCLGSLLFGGGAVIRHYSVRLCLAWEGTLRFPLSDRRLIAFLDAMRDRILLTRIGGGWVFIHRLLLEFLAGEPFGANVNDVAKNLRREGVESRAGG